MRPTTTTTCEFAVAVADDWQCRGIGTTLVPLLFEHAARAGFKTIYGTVLADNQRMIELAQWLGLTAGRKTARRPDGTCLAAARRTISLSYSDLLGPPPSRCAPGNRVRPRTSSNSSGAKALAMRFRQGWPAAIHGIVDLAREIRGVLACEPGDFLRAVALGLRTVT